MKFKNEDVKVRGIRPELLIAIMAVEKVGVIWHFDPIITSCADSKHSYTSLHYTGCAIDVRTKWGLPHGLTPEQFVLAIAERLTSEFDCILEGKGTDNEHIHVEFQPKSS